MEWIQKQFFSNLNPSAKRRLQGLMNTVAAFDLDVRTPEKHAERSLPGLLSIPYDVMEPRIAERGHASRATLVYCLRGHRGALAAGIPSGAEFANFTLPASPKHATLHDQEASQ